MLRRRHGEGENPAWPGLVDIFAFTLVLVLILWSGFDPMQKIEELESNIKMKTEENIKLKQDIFKLELIINDLTKKLIEITGNIISKLKDLYEILKSKKIDNYSVWLKENSFEIEIQGVPPIYFDTARYELSPADQSRLRSLAPELYESVRGKPYYIHINGTADPRELRGRGIPPHNYIELSALRAATVAALLEEAAPGLGEYLRIVGLGVRGREVPLKPGDDPEEVYRPYRTVTLVIKVDMEKWLSVPPAGQEGPKP